MEQPVTIITGGSMGIGLAIAQQQAASGAIVINLDLADFTQSVSVSIVEFVFLFM